MCFCSEASIKTGLMSGLKYRDPSPLLRTVGADWDYVGIEDLQKQLRTPLTQLCQSKGRGEDKMSHPLFLVVAAPGQGKSRCLQEFHRLADDTGLINSSSYGQRFLQFLLTLENGQKVDATYDESPQTILASRMLWQLLAKADFTRFGWAGLPPNFTFEQLRAKVATEGILVDEVIQALEKGEGLSGAKWSLSLALDGLHNLPGSESKSTTFYQTMQAVCQLVNRDMGPLVVGVISATTRVGVASSLADSPQQRAFIRLPRVEVVQRNGIDVFNFSGNKILELVQSDMGGHGRALEQLEIIGIQDPRSAENVVQNVRVELYRAYPSAIPDDCLPVLKAALAGKWLKLDETVGGQNPEKLQLVQLEYSSSGKLRRLLLPYIWIHLAIVDEPQLQDWALLDYRDINDKPDPNGFDWETFLVRFRALKSLVWNDGENVSLSDLHAGALINPTAFGGRCVKNRPLQIVTAKGWTATNAQHFGLKKGQGGTIGPDGQTALGGEDLQNGNYSYIVRNARSAPAADFAALLEDTSGKPFSECGQAKQGQANVDNQVMQDERVKSCDADDVLILFCTEEKHIQQQDLPPMTGIVQPAQWREYFGPYVGRAWAMQQDSRTP